MLSAVRRANLNGLYDIHTNQMHYPSIMQPTHARIEQIADGEEQEPDEASPAPTIFSAIKPSISRNFLVMDTHLETPPAGVAPNAYEVPFRTSQRTTSRRQRPTSCRPSRACTPSLMTSATCYRKSAARLSTAPRTRRRRGLRDGATRPR
jgi:hypothetical protein